MQKIDAHSHVGYFGGWADVGYTDEQMVAEMDRYGIEKSVVSYMDNTVVEQAVKRFPDRFVGITWANPYEGDKAVETVVREVREHGFQGIKLHPLLNAFTANDAVVHPLMINHKITEKEKRDNLGRRGIYFWQECNFVAEYVIEKEWGAPPF